MITRSSAVQLAHVLTAPSSFSNREALVKAIIENGDREEMVSALKNRISAEDRTFKVVLGASFLLTSASTYWGGIGLGATVGVVLFPPTIFTFVSDIHELKITLASVQSITAEISQSNKRD